MIADRVRIGKFVVGAYASNRQLIEELFARHEDGEVPVAVAVNPEKVVLAEECKQVANIPGSHVLSYADGIGVAWILSRRLNRDVPNLPGCDLWLDMMRVAGERRTPVFLLGAKTEIVADVVERLSSELNVNIVGSHDGYFDDSAAVIDRIESSGAQIVSVAMGSPRQEIFIGDAVRHGCNAIFLGVGGTYDVFVGRTKRAPVVFRRIGCEWLYRLISQPTRMRRQLRLVTYTSWIITGRL